VRAAFQRLLALGRGDDAGRRRLRQLFRLCEPLEGADEALQLAYWAQGSFDSYGMGAYPFASDCACVFALGALHGGG